MSTLSLCPTCGVGWDAHTVAMAELCATPLLSPECREGWHRECPGDPCEDLCHVTGEPGVAA